MPSVEVADIVELAPGRRRWPSVSIVIPVLDAAEHLDRCLDAVAAQHYPGVIEVVVVDGGSEDGTRAAAAGRAGVVLVDNPRRSRPAGMNAGIAASSGEVIVRVDARTVVAPDYVLRCVEALSRSGAAMVGGPMRLSACTARERGVAEAMHSRLGGGPARFRREDPGPGFTDTVYLGAFRRDTVLALGGYDEDFGGNEDAELAWRARRAGGVYLDPAIRSEYAVRAGLLELFRQYRRYGAARAGTMRKHPDSISLRQLALPALALGVVSPWRRQVLAAYLVALLTRSFALARRDPGATPSFVVAIPVMHAGWTVGMLRRLAGGKSVPS